MRSNFLALLLVAAPAFAANTSLVGPGVGSADSLVSEGTKLYNQKKYAKAAELFLTANRASPATLPIYLQLARSLLAAKQIQRSCYVYRVYLKAAACWEQPSRQTSEVVRVISTGTDEGQVLAQAVTALRELGLSR